MPELGYWAIRGLAEPIRMLLVHTKTQFTDKQYELQGEPGKWSAIEWKSVKETLGLDFPNLPYYIDGDVKITQSNAILRYIATKHDLVGKTEREIYTCYQMQDIAMDLRNAMTKVFYCPSEDYENAKSMLLTYQLPATLNRLEAFLEKNDWSCGASVTFVDFVLYELFDQVIRFNSSSLKEYPSILKFHQKFEHISPEIHQYVTSAKHIDLPINNKSANFK